MFSHLSPPFCVGSLSNVLSADPTNKDFLELSRVSSGISHLDWATEDELEMETPIFGAGIAPSP